MGLYKRVYSGQPVCARTLIKEQEFNMDDPLADIVNEDNISGVTPTHSLLMRMFEQYPPEVSLLTMETLLERVVLLETYIEEVKNFSVSSEELEDFRSRNWPRIEKEIALQTQLMFGKLAGREGG